MPRRTVFDAPFDFAESLIAHERAFVKQMLPGKPGTIQGHPVSAIPPGDEKMISATLTAVEQAREADGNTAGSPRGRPGR